MATTWTLYDSYVKIIHAQFGAAEVKGNIKLLKMWLGDTLFSCGFLLIHKIVK